MGARLACLCTNSPLPAGLKLLQAAGYSLSSRQREANKSWAEDPAARQYDEADGRTPPRPPSGVEAR